MSNLRDRVRLRKRIERGDLPIRHKIRGLVLGAPQGDHGQRKPAKAINVYVAGKPNYSRDANEIFSFLFCNVPHGTMLELLRLLGARLEDIAGSLAERAARLPSSPALNRRAWHDEPTDPPVDLPQLDLFEDPA